MNCYADDVTYVAVSKSREHNQTKVRENLDRIKTHLNANKLMINMGKTSRHETMLKQKRCKIGGSPPILNVVDDEGKLKIITARTGSRMLGGNFGHDLSW